MLKDAESAVNVCASSLGRYYLASVALDCLGRYHEATLMREKGVQKDPASRLLQNSSIYQHNVVTATSAPPPTTIQECSQNAMKFYDSGEYAEALIWYSRGIALHTEDTVRNASSTFVRRGECHLALGDAKNALQDADQALVLRQFRYAKASSLRVRTLVAMGRRVEALETCALALAASPDLLEFIELRKRLLGQVITINTKPGTPDRRNRVVNDGLAQVAAGKHTDAARTFTEALLLVGSKKQAAIIYVHRARCFMEQKECVKAVQDASIAMAMPNMKMAATKILMEALLELGKVDAVSIVCEAALRETPHDSVLREIQRSQKSRCTDQAAGKVKPPDRVDDDALRELPKAKELPEVATKPIEPAPKSTVQENAPHSQGTARLGYAREILRKGISRLNEEKYVDAEAHFTKALAILNTAHTVGVEVDTVRIKLLGHRARCRLAMEKYPAAAKDAQMGISFQPDWIDGNRILCHALMGQREWSKAMEACEKVLAKVPHDVAFRNIMEKLVTTMCDNTSRAQAFPAISNPSASEQFRQLAKQAAQLVKRHEYSVAATYCTDAIKVLAKQDPQDVSAFERAAVYINRARCYEDAGVFDSMLEDARAGLVHNPKWVEGYRLKCIASMKLERWEEARSACAEVLQQVPTDFMFQKHLMKITTMMGGVISQPVECFEEKTQGENVKDETAMGGETKFVLLELNAARLASLHQSSRVRQRYVQAVKDLGSAHKCFGKGDMHRGFKNVRDALALWPTLDIPNTILDVFLEIQPQDAVAWGGPMVYSALQARRMGFANIIAEKDFWEERVKLFPNDPCLHVLFADVLYRAHEVDLLRRQMEEVLKGTRYTLDQASFSIPASGHYLRARCLPSKASPLQRIMSIFSTEQQPNREDELLAYIERASFDDEWMPHACYTLGAYYLRKKDYRRAKEFHFVAENAEFQRKDLDLFPTIDENVFPDKKTLNEAFSANSMVLTTMEQVAAVTNADGKGTSWRCTECNPANGHVSNRVDHFVLHKRQDCSALNGHIVWEG